MKELIDQDIFELVSKVDAICIPTNCSIDDDQWSNPMFGGMAGEAAKLWDYLSSAYGVLLASAGKVPIICGWIDPRDGQFFSIFDGELSSYPEPEDGRITDIVAYPTMHAIGNLADLNLVKRSAELLLELAESNKWKEIAMGRNGCGIGGLSWEDQVKPIYQGLFDDRFMICHKEPIKKDKPLMRMVATEKQ
jgi:hypothetical protein